MINKLLKTGIACFLCLPGCFAQDVLWDKSYGGHQSDYLFDIQPTADYGFIAAGSSLSLKGGNKSQDNVGDLDYWVWKMNEDGELDWQKNMGGDKMDMLYSIGHTKDGGFILGGTSSSGISFHKKDSCRGRDDIWVVKLNAKGAQQWQRTLGGNKQELIKTIIATRDGGYIIGGSSASDTSDKILRGLNDPYGKAEACQGSLDYWIIKLNEKGEVAWQRTYGGIFADILESISPTADKGYIVGGYSNSPSSIHKSQQAKGEGDYWILKLDGNGNIEWQTVLGGEGDDHLYAVKQAKDGGYITAGSSSSNASGSKSKTNRKGTDFWVVKLSGTAEVLWQQTYNTGEVDILTSLVENKDGTILLGGYAQSEVTGTTRADKKEINDYIALKISPEGEKLWKETVGSSGKDILRKVIETRDGGYLLSGTSDGKVSRDKNSGKGSNDFWIVKLRDKDKKEEHRQRYKVEAMPNPAAGFTNVIVGFEFESGTASVFDLAGRQLQSFPVTRRTIPVDLGPYPEGIYIVEVATESGTGSVKVIKAGK